MPQKRVGFSTHLGLIFSSSIDIEARSLLKVLVLGDTDAEHVVLPAGDCEEVVFVLLVDYIYFFEVVVGEWVDPERAGGACGWKG